jgi:tricorn protease-like protein
MTMRQARRFGVVVAMTAAAIQSVGVSPALAGPAASPSVTGTWFDGLVAGVCFDSPIDAGGRFDFSVPAPVVPCDGPHGNEVVARQPLGGDAFPSSDLPALSEATCAPEYTAFVGRPIETTSLAPFTVWPDETDWAAGVRDVLCVVYGGGPLIGTAASGDLRAPGELLAVYRQVSDSADIWLVDAGTGAPLDAVTDATVTETLSPPSWTPDGASLLFGVQLAEDDVDVLQVARDGGAMTAVITGPGKQDGTSVSPDGSRLAYSSNEGGGEYDIFVRPIDGGAATRLTDHPGRDATPRWSPDGEQILFRRVTDGLSEIWVMNADGSDAVRLVDNGADSYDPRWSPDGTSILFSTAVGGSMDVWAADADGTNVRQLTDHPGAEEYPSFSSDGQFIAFQTDRHGSPEVWLMRADGSGASDLTGLTPVGYPSFSPVGIGR